MILLLNLMLFLYIFEFYFEDDVFLSVILILFLKLRGVLIFGKILIMGCSNCDCCFIILFYFYIKWSKMVYEVLEIWKYCIKCL